MAVSATDGQKIRLSQRHKGTEDGRDDMKKVILLLQIVTIVSWAIFLYIDCLWQEILRDAVTNGFYGEIYGPLSFFRPILLYSAIALTVLNSILFVIVMKKPGV